jgi:hypothetical protein
MMGETGSVRPFLSALLDGSTCPPPPHPSATQALFFAPALVQLSLHACTLDPPSLHTLACHPGLTWLDLSHTRFELPHPHQHPHHHHAHGHEGTPAAVAVAVAVADEAEEGWGVVREPPYLPEPDEPLSHNLGVLLMLPSSRVERLSLHAMRTSRCHGRAEAFFERLMRRWRGPKSDRAGARQQDEEEEEGEMPAFPRLRTLLLRESQCAEACLARLPFCASVAAGLENLGSSRGGRGGGLCVLLRKAPRASGCEGHRRESLPRCYCCAAPHPLLKQAGPR